MSTESQSHSKRTLIRLLLLAGVVAAGLAIASAVFAAWTTIDLTDGALDANWGTASYTEPTNDGSIADRDDLKNAWVRYDGTNLYFRIETWAGPALSATNMRAVGAIDCNHNGVFNDPVPPTGPGGDRLIIYAPSGTVGIYYYDTGGMLALASPVPGDFYDAPQTSPTYVNIEWGVPLYLLYPACRASVNPIGIAWSTVTGAGVIVDQSSSAVDVLNPMDYGDTGQTLPGPPATCGSPYTGLQCDGARHGLVPMTPGAPLRLGSAAIDADQGDLQSAGSDADDTNGTTPDDEGGIAPAASNSWSDGSGQLSFTVSGGGSVRVSCWVDFNKNGIWNDTINGTSEKILNNSSVNNTGATIVRAVTVPSGLTWGNDFPARCRLYPNTGPVADAFGPIEFGEVEDHIWSFDASGNYIAPGAPSAASGLAITTSGTSNVYLTWTNPSPNDSARVLGHATNPYFTSANSPFELDQLDTVAPWEYLHTGVRGAPASTVYYIVYGRLGVTEAGSPSNRVALFEFGLTAGTP